MNVHTLTLSQGLPFIIRRYGRGSRRKTNSPDMSGEYMKTRWLKGGKIAARVTGKE